MMDQKFKQLEAYYIGNSGCYFLSFIEGLKRHIEKKTNRIMDIDIFKAYEKALENGWIDFECSMNNPDEFGKFLSGFKCSTRKESIDTNSGENEFEITQYVRTEDGETVKHFVLTENGNVIYDPWGNSKTVRVGKPISKRIVRVYI